MKTFCLSLILFLLPLLSFAQSRHWLGAAWSCLGDDSWTIATPADAAGGVVYSYEWEDRDRLGFGLSYRRAGERGWFQEYSLIDLRWREQEGLTRVVITDPTTGGQVSGERVRQGGLRLRYQYGYQWGAEERRLRPGLAAGIDPFAHYLALRPYTSAFFPASRWQAGAVVQVLPRLDYRLAARWQVWLEAPVPLASLYWERTKLENPLLPRPEQRQSSLRSDWGPAALNLRVGVAWRM